MDGFEYELYPYKDEPRVEIADREHGCHTGRGCITVPVSRLDEFVAWVQAIRDQVRDESAIKDERGELFPLDMG